MSVQACADLVFRGDPDRFRAAMAAPVVARDVLFPLYAFNLEVSRAPWVTAEPMIAEMRLQFWRDTLEEIGSGAGPRAHEVADVLGFLDADAAACLDRLVVARRWDVGKAPFEDLAAFEGYIDATSGHLTWTAARALGAAANAESAVRAVANAAGVARYLMAVPALESLGRIPLVDGTHAGIAALAAAALDRWPNRPLHQLLPLPARSALFDTVTARKTLELVRREPGRVADAALGPAPFAARLALMRLAIRR